MQEFSSISVSSYEAGSLADRLTEQSGAGWNVIAIVPTGSTITAYLSREAGSGPVPSAVSAVSAVAAFAPEASYAPETSYAPEIAIAPEPAAPAPVSAAEMIAATTVQPDPVSEPAGWAVAPEATGPAAAVPQVQAVVEAPAASAAPAGWYADPSSRYELRYWDGGQWTEHVSRNGQQFTDPPVA